MAEDLAERIAKTLAIDIETFEHQIQEDAETLKGMVTGGDFDNPQALTGLEYEFYAVKDIRTTTDPDTPGSLARVPRKLLEFIRFEKELGLHNAELSTSPLPVNAEGIAAQEAELGAQIRTALNSMHEEGLRLVSDGMWTIPPIGESARTYLTQSVEDGDYRIAVNMSDSPRYHAMGNANTSSRPSMRIDAPYVSLSADTVMPESLTTSIQPHYQVPRAVNLPVYFRYALRVAGPLTALGVNSPFLPPDIYDECTVDDVLGSGWHGNRIRVFESVMNNPEQDVWKVRFPGDFYQVEDAIDRIAADPVMVPISVDSHGRFDDAFATFRQKSGTYWRWVRPIFEGPSRGAANARIEFRPIAAQPTIRDSVAFQAAFTGLMEALPAIDHPVIDLDWTLAESNFYDAARAGLRADLEWITADGTRTENGTEIYEDLLDQAAEGLRACGLSETEVGRYIGPLRRRVRHGMTPATWKRREVRSRANSGASLEEAIAGMQRAYLEWQADTLFDGEFVDWIESDVGRSSH